MGGRLRHYRVVKNEPSPAGYVLASLRPGQWWALASLRSGYLPLAMETGRYRIPKVPLDQRLCNNNCIEDEFYYGGHFLTKVERTVFLSISVHHSCI